MKLRRFCFFVLFSVIQTFCFANITENKICFTISPKAGFISGSYKEEFFAKIDEENQMISLLHWQIQAAPTVDISSTITLNNTFVAGINCFYTIPFNSGKMEDYDWMNWYSSQTGEQTHYSWHKNKLQNLYEISGFLGMNIPFTKKMNFQPSVIYTYKYYDFSAIDGFKQYNKSISGYYPEWTKDIPKQNLYGTIITYKGDEYSLGFGTKFDFKPANKINLSTDLIFLHSIKANSLDSHLKRNNGEGLFLIYRNSGKNTVKANLAIDYFLNEHNSLFADSQFNFSVKKNSKITDTVNTGAEISTFWRFNLGYTYKYEK